LPVIVFIHGGGYIFGYSTLSGPSYLLTEDVIFVTMNYRLGFLGFLSTGDEQSPGNYGMKDQALAIKWVYDNIEQFGGNKSLITVMGNSAGGSAAHLHLLSRNSVAAGKFSRVISLSGTALHSWGFLPLSEALRTTEKLARALNCPVPSIDGTQAFMDCVKTVDPYTLTSMERRLGAS